MERRTLVEVYVQMSEMRQGVTLDEVRVLVLQLLAHGGKLVLGELPMPPLRRFPEVGCHGLRQRWFAAPIEKMQTAVLSTLELLNCYAGAQRPCEPL